MKITNLTAQVNHPERLNLFMDGQFKLSLDIAQVVNLGLKVGMEVSVERLAELEQESAFGKLYAQALNYCLVRPRSVRELRDYLQNKSLPANYKTRRGEVKQRPGLAPELTERVLLKLQQKHYLDDVKFAAWWVENRFRTKGVSSRRLRQDLVSKGVSNEIIEQVLTELQRDDVSELAKIIAKKARRYPDRHKLMRYLTSRGFNYEDIKQAIDRI